MCLCKLVMAGALDSPWREAGASRSSFSLEGSDVLFPRSAYPSHQLQWELGMASPMEMSPFETSTMKLDNDPSMCFL